MNPYREIFEQLNAKHIHYLVVGGVAVNLHGYSRFTGDVDVVLALDHANLDAMGKLMDEMKFTQRLPIDIRELSDAKRVQKFLEEKGMTAYTYIDPHQPQFSIDILASASLDFDQFDTRKVLIEMGELSIPVISIDDLIGMKKMANRQKDIFDIEALLQLKGL